MKIWDSVYTCKKSYNKLRLNTLARKDTRKPNCKIKIIKIINKVNLYN